MGPAGSGPEGARDGTPATPPAEAERHLEQALRIDRRFSLIFGGYALELPGAHLVVNEKIPAPRFNFVQDVRCSAGRVTALMEHTLEHYYQRALRPTFELRSDRPQPWLVRSLKLAGYEPQGPEHRRHLLRSEPGRRKFPTVAADSPPEVVALEDDELGEFATLLVPERHQQEVIRSLTVIMAHPDPGEKAVAYAVRASGKTVCVGLYYELGSQAGLFAVGTLPSDRMQGHATQLVARMLSEHTAGSGVPAVISLEGSSPPGPLLRLGFQPLASFDVYALSPQSRRRGF